MQKCLVAKFGKQLAEAITTEEFEEWLYDLADERNWASETGNHCRSGFDHALSRGDERRHGPSQSS
jgi:hypothetical protein